MRVRHNECTTPCGLGRQKRCTIRTCLRLSGPLHRTSTSSHGGEATGSASRELYPWSRHQAPVAQRIEQAPSKRLAAGSSPAGGAFRSPPFGEGFLLVRAGTAGRASAPDALLVAPGAARLPPGSRGWPCRIRVEVSVPQGRWGAGSWELLAKIFSRFEPPLQTGQLPVDTAGVGGREHGDAVLCPGTARVSPAARPLRSRRLRISQQCPRNRTCGPGPTGTGPGTAVQLTARGDEPPSSSRLIQHGARPSNGTDGGR